MAIEDCQLSKHFPLFELTKTAHDDLQEENRDGVSALVERKLASVAALLEDCWDIVGPFGVTSGYRCPILNRRVGGSAGSQHLKGEAADFVTWGVSVEDSFDKLCRAAKARYFRFGQLILEEGSREGHRVWIHISLGAPYRDPARCGQIMKMEGGKYELIAMLGGKP